MSAVGHSLQGRPSGRSSHGRCDADSDQIPHRGENDAKCQHRTSSPDKGTGAQSRKVSTHDLSSRCFSLAYECWGKDRMGAELLPTATSIGRHYITADLDGRAIPRFQVCLIASKRMLEFTRQVSFAQTSGRRTCVRRGRWTRFIP